MTGKAVESVKRWELGNSMETGKAVLTKNEKHSSKY